MDQCLCTINNISSIHILPILFDHDRYQNLVVHDATGRQVKSTMCWETEGPHIVLNVLETPVFPVLIGTAYHQA